MNKKAKFEVGAVLILVAIIFLFVAFATIDPLKESLDNNRNNATLNCPDAPNFNQTAYDLQNTTEKLTYRPTCFITGISLVWYIGIIVIALAVWVVKNWRRP